MAQFDPSDEDVDATLKYLASANRAERDRVLALEVQGKKRKTVLEKYGVDPDARYGATGRPLYPWEAVGEQKADADRVVEEDEDAKAAREAQLEQDELVAAASAQLGSSPAGSGAASAATGAASAASAAPASGGTGGAAGGTGGTSGGTAGGTA